MQMQKIINAIALTAIILLAGLVRVNADVAITHIF
jgi:hypothetical protein